MLKQWTISATTIEYGRLSLWVDKAREKIKRELPKPEREIKTGK